MSIRDGLTVVAGAGAMGVAELDELAACCAIRVVPKPNTHTAAIQRPFVRKFKYFIPISSATLCKQASFICKLRRFALLLSQALYDCRRLMVRPYDSNAIDPIQRYRLID